MSYFLKQKTKDNISIGVCYSIFQKCIRRCLTSEALYYGNLIYSDGTPNSLRKRLVMSSLEDMGNLNLALEIMNCQDSELFDYVKIASNNKKSHISAWLQGLSLDYAIYNTKTDNEEIKQCIKMHQYEKVKNYKKIKEFLGKDISKLYTFMDKQRLVWVVKIISNRPELNYQLDRTLEKVNYKKFKNIPDWAMDKHVPGGTPGYKFFFEHGLVMSNRIYPDVEPYQIECMNIYLDKEKNTKESYQLWVNDEIKKEYIPAILEEYGYRNIIQIQLLTRKNYPKVYFATKFSDGKKYVLKGPISETDKNALEYTEKIKKIIKYPRLNSIVLQLSEQYWLQSDSVVDYQKDTVFKESKLESSRPIYNGNKLICCFDDFFATHRNVTCSRIDLVLATLFKNLISAKDFASRNYLHNGSVYSIDDHTYLPEEPDIKIIPDGGIKKEVVKNWKNFLKIGSNKDEILGVLKKWKKRIKRENKKSKIDHYDILLKRIKLIKKEIINV